MTRKPAQRHYKNEINRESALALEAVANRLLAEKEAEIGRLTEERDRYKAALEIIAGSSDRLQATQALGALSNIGADVSGAHS